MKRLSALFMVAMAFVFLVSMTPRMVFAQDEFSLFGGALRGANDGTFIADMEYLKTMKQKPFAFSIATIDEGHLDASCDKHHRDGFIGQVWAYHELTPRLSLWAGIGPYVYYDTQAVRENAVYKTGVAMITSADIKYRMTENWFLKLRTNAVVANISTQSVLVGVGRNLSNGEAAGRKNREELKNTVTALKSMTNVCIEYRRGLIKHIDATATYYAGDKATGAGAEIWLVDRFFDNKVKIGIGAGPYRDMRYDDSGWSGIVTATGRYEVHPLWDVVVQWDRVHTHNHDADLNSIGIGYKF